MLRKHVIRKSFGPGLLFMLPLATTHTISYYSLAEVESRSPLPVKHQFWNQAKAASFDSMAVKTPAAISIQLNKTASKIAKAYIKKEAEFLQKMTNKKSAYFADMEAVLSQYNV